MPLYGSARALNKKAVTANYGIGVWTREVTLDGSNPTPLVTPFKKIIGASGQIKGTAAQAVGAAGVRRLSFDYPAAGATINMYAWGHVLADATEIASTNATAVISVVVVGEY